LWVGGLIGVLVTVAVLGLLGVRVLASVGERSSSVEQTAEQLPEVASAETCRSSRRILEVALTAYLAQNGSAAPDQQALVSAGLLSETVDEFVYDPAAPEPLVGVGPCAE
jgi:hypothetical protein